MRMKTIVYQSYRTSSVPPWITECLASVRDWVKLQGFDYAFVDDQLFEYAPQWYRDKVNNDVLLVSDLARLKLAKEFLSRYQRAIWVDADVLVFNPEKLQINVNSSYAFCKEEWIGRKTWKEILYSMVTRCDCSRVRRRTRVNNAVAVFVENNCILDFYIHAAESLVRNKPAEDIGRWDVGTALLTALHHGITLPLLENVALLSPLLIRDIVADESSSLSLYAGVLHTPVYAANLCGSMVGRVHDGVPVTEALLCQAIQRLLFTKGARLNALSEQTAR